VTPGESLTRIYAALVLTPPTPRGLALSKTNRYRLILAPDAHLLTATLPNPGLVASEDFIDFVALEPDLRPISHGKATSIVWAGGGSPAIVQTASDVRFMGLSVENTGTTLGATAATSDSAFLQAADCSDSVYSDMGFWNNSPGHTPDGIARVPFAADETHDLTGTFYNCHTPNYGFRVHYARKVTAKFWDSTTEDYGFAGDCSRVMFDGEIHGGGAGKESVGGCSVGGADVGPNALIEDAYFGDNCVAHGSKIHAGAIVRRNRGGKNFCAGSVSNTNATIGCIEGTVEDNFSSGGRSFGAITMCQMCRLSTT
jgi:hypothetical protein